MLYTPSRVPGDTRAIVSAPSCQGHRAGAVAGETFNRGDTVRQLSKSPGRFAAILLAAGLLSVTTAIEPVSAQPANRFFISNLEGDRFDGRKFSGPIVISFFFVGCPPCVREIPQLS